jgi:hypothetical protein
VKPPFFNQPRINQIRVVLRKSEKCK